MPQRPSLAELYGGAGAPAPAPRPALEDLYGASGFDMRHIAELEKEFGITPAAPEFVERGRKIRQRSSIDPERGSFMEFVDRVANASPRDWLGNIVRYGGGYLSGIPSAIPGPGTLLGGAIGSGSESLAEFIQGEEQDPTAIGVAGGVGMIPFGGIVGTTGRAGARGAGVLARAAAVGKQTGANALKGATLGAGQEMAYRFGQEGQLPGRDYGARELVIPSIVGAGGLALAGELGSRALERGGIVPPDSAGSPGGFRSEPSGPTLRGDSPAARRANYRYDYQGGPRPSLDELYGHLKPEPLDLTRTRIDPTATPSGGSNRPAGAGFGDPRRGGAPLREGVTLEGLFGGPEPFLATEPADFPSLHGPGRPQGVDPRRAGSPLREGGGPVDLSGPEPFLPGEPGDFPGMAGPARPRGVDPRRGGPPLREGVGPIDLTGPEPFLATEPGDFPSLQGPGRPQGMDPRRAGSPPTQRTPTQLVEDFIFGQGNRGGVVPEQGPLPVPDWSDPGTMAGGRIDSTPSDRFFVEPPTRTPRVRSDVRMPGSRDVRAAQEALGGGNSIDDVLADFFGLDRSPRRAVEPGAGPVAPVPDVPVPQEPPAPSVGRMTAAELLERLKAGDAGVRLPGLTGGKLPPDVANELRLMVDELAEFPFQRAELNTNIDDALTGGPGTRDWSGGAGYFQNNPDHPNLIQTVAGAPVFHDIMQGKGGSRSAAARGLARILEGGRPTSLTDRAVDVAQQRLLGGLGRSLPPSYPDVRIQGPYRPPRDMGFMSSPFSTQIEPPRTGRVTLPGENPLVPNESVEVGGVGRIDLPEPPRPPAPVPATGAPGGGDIDPRIRQLHEELLPRWQADVEAQQLRGDPFVIDQTESLEDFARRIMEEPDPRKLWGRERKIRKMIDAERGGGDAGFIDPDLLMPLGGTLAGAVGGAAMNPDDPWSGTVAGAGIGFAGGMAGRALRRGGFGPGVVDAPPSRALQRIMDADLLGAEDLRPKSYKPQGSGTYTGPDIPRNGRFNRADYPNLATADELAADVRRLTEPGAPRPTDLNDDLPALARTGDASAPAFAGAEAGFADPQLLMTLGGAAAGAIGGSIFEPEHRGLGALAGAGVGALALNPRAQRAAAPYLYDAMLSALATPKNLMGVTGSIAGAAFEHPERARDIAREFFSGQTLRDVGALDIIKKPIVKGSDIHSPNRWAVDDDAWRGPFTQLMGNVDQATNSALQRAGFPESQARALTGTSDPVSETGRNILGVARNMPLLLPFARTGLNLMEQGLLRTPGINMLPDVMAMETPGMSSRSRRAVLGALAAAGGAGYGYLSSEGGPLEDYAGGFAEKVGMPGFGLASVPATTMSAATRALMKEGTPLEGLNAGQRAFFDQLPLPEAVPPQEALSRFAPALGAYLSPVAPNKFETRRGIFDPTIARLPFLNEMVLDRKGGRPARRPPARRQIRPFSER